MYVPEHLRPAPVFVAWCNAIAFVLLMIWFVWVAERVWIRSRQAQTSGRYALWRHPNPGIGGRLSDFIANSHFLRAFGERAPVLCFASNITDVVYVNYLVDAERLLPLIPKGLELQRLGAQRNHALFTFLTYRHGHLGPVRLGPFRRVLPSPIQSNWRIYVTDPLTGRGGVYFVATCINSTVHALATRLLAEGMPMHVPERMDLRRDTDGVMHLTLIQGSGTSPDLHATLRSVPDRTLPTEWLGCFSNYSDFLAYCVPQDRALSSQSWYSRLTRQEISLKIPLDACEPLRGEIQSRTVEKVVGHAKPVCFRVAKVDFRFLEEVYESSPLLEVGLK